MHEKSFIEKNVGLCAWVGLCLAVEILAGWMTSYGVSTWYQSLIRPSWTPPDWLFGPVWTFLYLSMGVAVWRVWLLTPTPERRAAFLLFYFQLILNLLWSGFFFALRRPGLGFIDIVLLLFAILATLMVFIRLDRWAGWLLAPYLVWVGYAAALNFSIWRLNAS